MSGLIINMSGLRQESVDGNWDTSVTSIISILSDGRRRNTESMPLRMMSDGSTTAIFNNDFIDLAPFPVRAS